MVATTTDTTHRIELLEQKDEKDDRKCACRISDIFKYAPFPHQHPNKIRRPDAINM